MSEQQTAVYPTTQPDQHREWRDLVQHRYRYRRGECTAEIARQRVQTGLSAPAPALVSASVPFLVDLCQREQSDSAGLEQDGLERAVQAVDRVDVEPDGALLALAQDEPTRFASALGPLLAAAREPDAPRATSALSAIAARDPAVLKPVLADLVTSADDSEPMQWIVGRLTHREPALTRRHVANSLWTARNAAEEEEAAAAAARSLGVVLAATPDVLPEYTVFRQLLSHPSPDTRRAAAAAVPHLVEVCGGTDEVEWEAITGLLVRELREGEWYARETAATALGHLGRSDRVDTDAIVGSLTAQLPDSVVDVRRAILSAVRRIASQSPDDREAGTVERIAALFGDATAVEALAAAEAHGGTALATLGVDEFAVLLGSDDTGARERAVETLLSLGMCSPSHRSDLLAALCWALYDTDECVRRAAVDAVGVAGSHWPATAPKAVDALFDYVSREPDELADAADALIAIAQSFDSATPAFVDRLQRDCSPTTVAACLRRFAAADPESVATALDWLVDRACRPTDEGGADAAHALRSVAEADAAALEPYVDQLRTALAEGKTTPDHWAMLATALGLVADSGTTSQPAAWLSRRFHDEPLVFGPALSRLVQRDPETAFPPVAGLLATLQRSGGHVDTLDVEVALDNVVGELVGAHPVVALPVVRTLTAVLDEGENSATAARLLDAALDAWPYLAPMAEQPLIARLDDGDHETLVAVARALAGVSTPAADDALAQLRNHPSDAVRTAAARARSQAASSPGVDLGAVDPSVADASTVDRIATALGGEQTRQAVDVLRSVDRTTPELRTRIVTHLLGYVGVRAGAGVEPVVLEALGGLAPPGVTADPGTPDAVGLVLGLTEADEPLVGSQALAALHYVAASAPETLDTGAVAGAAAQIDADNHLVQHSAIWALCPLVRERQCDRPELAARLERYLFSPHALVPVTAWAVGELAVAAPESVDPVAESLTGLQDWDQLARYNATETIRASLASRPSVESAVAESLRNRLAVGDERPSRTLVRAVGLLSGKAIAANDGSASLFSTLEAVAGFRSFLLAERLEQVAEVAPEAVLRALAERETLPEVCAASAPSLFRTVERLIDYDASRVELPLLDIIGLFDEQTAGVVAEIYDRTPISPNELGDALTRAQRPGARILAKTGKKSFLKLLEQYDSLASPVRPAPELIVTYLLRTDSDEGRRDAAERLREDVPTELCEDVAELLLTRIETVSAERRAQLLALLPTLATAAADPSVVDGIVAAVGDGLSGPWAVRLAGIEALSEVGLTDAIQAASAADMLTECLSDSEPTVRRNAAEALCDVCLGGVVDIGAVVDDLGRAVAGAGSDAGRRGCAIALGLIGAGEPGVREQVVDRLLEVSGTDDDLLRRRCLEALETVADVDPAALDGHLDRIGPRVTDRGFPVQVAAVECLSSTASVPRLRALSTQYLTDALAAEDVRVQQLGVGALAGVARTNTELGQSVLTAVRDAVGADSPTVRADAARCLSYAGSKSDIETLRPLTSDPDQSVKTAATEGIARLKRQLSGSAWQGVPMHRYTPTNRGARSVNGPELDEPAIDWQFEAEEPIQAAPTAVGDTVYVAAEDHCVYALDTATGETRWRYRRDARWDRGLGDLFGDGGSPDANRSSPAVVGDDLYVGHCRSEGAELYNLDAATGERKWTSDAGAHVFCSPATVGGTVYVGTSNGEIVALDADTGAEQWTVATGSTVTSSPTVVHGTLYVGCHDGTVRALDTADGSEQWRYATDDFVTATPAVSGSSLYVGSYDAHLYALDAVTGAELWAVELDGVIHSSAAVSDGTVYVGSSGGAYALDAVDGTREWVKQATADGALAAAPAVRGDSVYVGGHAGAVRSLDAGDGATRWTVAVGAPVKAPLVVEGHSVYAATTDGVLHAIRD